MDYQTLKQNQSQFLALTSLYPDEFDRLLAEFTPHWERYYRYRTPELCRYQRVSPGKTLRTLLPVIQGVKGVYPELYESSAGR